MTSRSAQNARIAIIGGGFSGTMVLANLVRELDQPATIDLFESATRMNVGVAYSTTDPVHLLNVRSNFMGAFAKEPDHFFRWLSGKHKDAQPDGFAPRMIYADYLKHILDESLTLAKQKNISVTLHQKSIDDSDAIKADATVLAIGNLPPRRFAFESTLGASNPRYVADMWKPEANSLFPDKLSSLPENSCIVIIGSGLTTIDAVLTLRAKGFRGRITALSRHGHLPAVHAPAKPYPAWEWITHPDKAPKTALGLLTRFKREIRSAVKQGYDWRAVVDSVRPVTQILWKQLPPSEKKRFFARLFTLWNIHRHRMAPQIGSAVAELQASGHFEVLASSIQLVTPNPNGLTITHSRGSIDAALLINCTGPQYDLASSPHALLRNLYQRGQITSHPDLPGIELAETGSTRGSDALFPIGTPLIGELLECTAVPELRAQAHEVAARVLQHVKDKDKNSLCSTGT